MDTRNLLLEAASAVVSAQGSRALTLDAVARQAGVSKGGLLYHFPTKSALMAGMVAQGVESFERALVAAEGSTGDWLAGYVEATLADTSSEDPLSGVFAALAEEPELLAPFRAALQCWYQKGLTDYGPRALPLLLALDGLWIHVRMGTLPDLPTEEYAGSLRLLARAVVEEVLR